MKIDKNMELSPQQHEKLEAVTRKLVLKLSSEVADILGDSNDPRCLLTAALVANLAAMSLLEAEIVARWVGKQSPDRWANSESSLLDAVGKYERVSQRVRQMLFEQGPTQMFDLFQKALRAAGVDDGK